MKQKTHKGLGKRVKVSKTGKVRIHKGGGRHLKSKKSGKEKRQLRKASVMKGKTAKVLREALS